MTNSQRESNKAAIDGSIPKAPQDAAFFISVIVPIFNTPPRLLRQCLESLSKQTLRAHEFEIILVDDASSDEETTTFIDAFVSGEPKSQLVRHAKNGGLNEARRSGLHVAKGKYIVFVDGDDFLARDGLETLRMTASETGADIISAPMMRWDSDKCEYRPLPHTARAFPQDYTAKLTSLLSGQHTFSMCGRLFARDLLTDSVFDIPRNLFHEDRVTFTRVFFGCENTSETSKVVYFYSFNEGSISSKLTKKHAEDIFWAFGDWINTANKKGNLDQLLTAMTVGFEVFVNDCLERCVLDKTIGSSEKVKTIQFIHNEYDQSQLKPDAPSQPGTKLLSLLTKNDFQGHDEKVLAYLEAQFGIHRKHLQALSGPESDVVRMKPSDIARRTKDKIVLIGQVDYQLRTAAQFAKELRKRGHACVVLDNSAFVSDGRRRLSQDEWSIFWRTEHIAVQSGPYDVDWLSTAKLVITFNDFNEDFRDALEFRHHLGLPSACMIEGINDFLRVDFETYRYLPYRRCDHVFLAGFYDQSFFEDRLATVIGMPILEQLSTKEPEFPDKPLAALNVNFTYGAIESQRDRFVKIAKAAFESADWDWTITQHPEDQGDLCDYPVSTESQYQLIEQCTVFVSRFATGILEALASGKPVIYFNPHDEKVDKFKEPLGAFEIATNEEELVAALQSTLKQVESGTDFREQAKRFLEHHAGLAPGGKGAGQRFADAAIEMIDSTIKQQDKVSDRFFTRLDDLWPHRPQPVGLVFGQFKRENGAQLNDEEMISHYFGSRGSIMIDVGANFGNSCDVYLGKNWTVHAFEPDPNNRKALLDAWPDCANLIVNDSAVSDVTGQKVPFYASDESTGISGLSAFTEGHKQIGHVLTTTLRDYYDRAGLQHVDFLKVDVEGFDKFVLDGFPWDTDRPDVVLAEFEDAKTKPLGYDAHDLAGMMVDLGYKVYVSEWHPILRYGIAHDWKRFVQYSSDLELDETWGNMIGFKNDPGTIHLRDLVKRTMKFGAKAIQTKESATPNRDAPKTRFTSISRLAHRLVGFPGYCLRLFRRRPVLLGGGTVIGIILPLLLAILNSNSSAAPWLFGIAGLATVLLSNTLVFAFARATYLQPPQD